MTPRSTVFIARHAETDACNSPNSNQHYAMAVGIPDGPKWDDAMLIPINKPAFNVPTPNGRYTRGQKLCGG